MAIPVPWTAALSRDEDKRDVILDNTGDPSYDQDRIKLHIPANADPTKRTSIIAGIEKLKSWFLAYMQAITGIFYTTVLVASLIGMQLAHYSARHSGGQDTAAR